MTFVSGGISWTRVRLPRVLSTSFLALYTAFAILSVSGIVFDAPPLLLVISSVMRTLSWGLLIASYIVWFTSSWTVGQVDVEPGTLIVTLRAERPRRIPRSDIVGALVVERPVGDGVVQTVEIELRGGDRLTARLPDGTTAQSLVAALGFGPGGARVRSRLATPSRRLLHVPIAVGVWMAGAVLSVVGAAVLTRLLDVERWRFVFAALEAVWPVITVALYVLLRRAARAPEVVLGDEGTVAERGLRRRFFPRADASLQTALKGVLLDEARRAAVLRLAAERASVTSVPTDRLAAFTPLAGPIDQWRADLRRRLDEGTYRSTNTTVADATAALRSPDATPAQRVGAALALRVAGEPPGRIRVAAEASVDDDVRLALDAVASDDDARLARALRRLR